MEAQKCVICLESCSVKNSAATFASALPVVEGQQGAKVTKGLTKDLNVIFLLRHVLKVPQSLCAQFLLHHGNPADWQIFICASCYDNYVTRALLLQEQSVQLQQSFQTLSSQVMDNLKASALISQAAGDPEPQKNLGRGKRKNKSGGPGPVFTKIRSWVNELNAQSNGADVEEIIGAVGGIDQYVAQQKAEQTFRALGPGRKLTAEPAAGSSSAGASSSSGINSKSNSVPPVSADAAKVSEEKKAAAAAALARMERLRKPDADSKQMLNARQAAFIKDQVRKEMEMENGQSSSSSGDANNNSNKKEPAAPKVADPSAYAVKGVYYRCPEIDENLLLPKKEMDVAIREHLLKQLHEDEINVACLLIKSCNAYPDMVETCVGVLCKYLDFIIAHPSEPKYRQIRCSNRIFLEKVRPLLGAEEFLKAVGFTKEYIEVVSFDDREEEFWVYEPPEEGSYIKELMEARDQLRSTQPLRPILDRNLQVLKPQEVATRNEFPDDFYALSVEEIRRQQELKAEIAEGELTLRTKAMRERDEMREQFIYRFGVIRVKFPDSLILQGTFLATEKISSIFSFVRENLVLPDLIFQLIQSGGENLNVADENATIASLKLTPSAILNFRVENPPDSLACGEISYLNPDLVIAALN